MSDRFVTVTVEAVCACGTVWHTRTTRRTDLPDAMAATMDSCPLCGPQTVAGSLTLDEEKDA